MIKHLGSENEVCFADVLHKISNKAVDEECERCQAEIEHQFSTFKEDAKNAAKRGRYSIIVHELFKDNLKKIQDMGFNIKHLEGAHAGWERSYLIRW